MRTSAVVVMLWIMCGAIVMGAATGVGVEGDDGFVVDAFYPVAPNVGADTVERRFCALAP